MKDSTVDLVVKSATTFYMDLKEDPSGRYHFYKAFHDAREVENVDVDYLSLQLAFYLAS